MTVVENYTVPFEELPTFLADHVDQRVIIRECTENSIKFNITCDYTEPEFHMGVLFNLAHRADATQKDKKAVDYAIGAIKTLVDMGVLKEV